MSASQAGIPGLDLILEFVSTQEEVELLALVDAQPWEYLAKRRVQHHGMRFEYATRHVEVGAAQAPLPPALHDFVALRLAPRIPGSQALDQVTVNEYVAGVGLSPHVDTHSAFGDTLLSLSLAGPCVMVFRKEGRADVALALPPRSLLVLQGEARHAWQHYIPHRKSDMVGGEVVLRAERRVSFTFRQVRQEGDPCSCPFPDQCDSQGAGIPPTRMAAQRAQCGAGAGSTLEDDHVNGVYNAIAPHFSATRFAVWPKVREFVMALPPGALVADVGCGNGKYFGLRSDIFVLGTDRSTAQRAQCGAGAGSTLEDDHVNGVYNAIAPHFSATRFAVWPKVREFVMALPPGALVADVGCGNGKYFGLRSDIFVLGTDRSTGLAGVASQRVSGGPMRGLQGSLRADVAAADALALPLRPACMDGVLCIAVLHHMSTVARRLALLHQLLSTLCLGGRALVTVWATEQEGMARKLEKWAPLPGSESEANDYLVPWHVPMHRAEAAAAAARPSAVLDGKKSTVCFQRYYHLFRPGELEGLVRQVPGAQLLDAFYDKDNWCVVFGRL
ncbi:Alkylated DNA repair protein alkB-like protein 8 [Auxenochlorella protothecoides]|uniref:Alkylated DNA repair protein alkB-like protein 8 n=1 Tax=Auxenochlorella protothecoides TaxID=3075 RepID=A0A087SEH5_AUXPR|nr:Alkylated DNA repair protein alkB-like protein 8 [Auxenochlorella protothecoides]KFM24129.1 Alkylated DNA repair protein alkB-like protein 8 [Auxenochlorella protothecoides]